MAWQEKNSLFEDAGDMGGDVQVGKAYSRRFFNPDLPGRLITINLYPVKEEGSAVIGVQMQTEFMICRDIEDPGSTEEWSTYRYVNLPIIGFGTAEQAELSCMKVLPKYDPAGTVWNGEPF